jgi:hypothetical protein
VIVVTDSDIPAAVIRRVLAEPGVLEGRTLRI